MVNKQLFCIAGICPCQNHPTRAYFTLHRLTVSGDKLDKIGSETWHTRQCPAWPCLSVHKCYENVPKRAIDLGAL